MIAPGTNRRKRIVIVGGSAKAARAVRTMLAKSDHEVTIQVRRDLPPLADEMISVVKEYGADMPLDVDVVISFVGSASGSRVELEEANIEAPARVGERSKAAGAKALVHLGSLAVYGKAERVGRSTPEVPINDYGRSKLAGDRRLLSLASEDFQVAILRVPTLYGDGIAGKIKSLAEFVDKTGVIPVARPPALRSVLHVQNLALALCRFVEVPVGGVRFVADPQPFSLDRLAAATAARTGRRPMIMHIPGALTGRLSKISPAFRSLFGSSVIDPEALMPMMQQAMLPMDACLDRIF